MVVVLGGISRYKSCMWKTFLAHSLVLIQNLFLSKLPAPATSSVGLGLGAGAEAGDVIGLSNVKVGVQVGEGHGCFNLHFISVSGGKEDCEIYLEVA